MSDSENPFKAPETGSGSIGKPRRPTGLDYFIAVLLGTLAVCLLFPTSCFGSLLVIASAKSFVSPAGAIAILLACLILSIAAGVWIARYFVKSAQKSDLKKRGLD